jgi:hypothetical protein
MNAPSKDIREMLLAYGESSGMGIAEEDIHCGLEPATPKNVITIFDTSGFPPYISISGETGYEYPSVNIRVRNTKYTEGWELIEKIKTILHGKHQETWNGTLYSVITCSSGPAHLDWDDNRNARFIINFDMQRRPA